MIVYNFGALEMPEGYSVQYHEEHEHYQAHGPDGWESCITCNPHQARRWCVQREMDVAQARRWCIQREMEVAQADEEVSQYIEETMNASDL